MTFQTLRNAIAVLGFCLASAALAHDPKEHAKDAAAAKAGPDCAKLKRMDMSSMDPADPLTKALHARCDTINAAAHVDEHDHDHDATHDAVSGEKKDTPPAAAQGEHR
ncbi:MAG: hypothetical protein ABI411_19025 [Tahibacter sp.]